MPAPAQPEAAVPQPDQDTSAGDTERGAATQDQQRQEQRRDVIRTASLTVVVADPEADSERVQQEAESAGGYVANVQSGVPVPCRGVDCPEPGSGGSGSTTMRDVPGVLTVTIRVPANRYDAVLDSIREMGEVAKLSVNADDVTQQTQDLDARIVSQRASVARVRQMMRRATTIDELVRVESELASRQSDLESMLAQRKRLDDAVALATVTVTLVSPDSAGEIIEPDENWWDAPWNAFTESWQALFIFIAAITPLIVLGLLGLIVVLAIMRRRRRSKQSSQDQGEADVPEAGQQESGAAPQEAGASSQGDSPQH